MDNNHFANHATKLILALPLAILLIGVSSKALPRQLFATTRHDQTLNSSSSPCNFPAVFNFGDSNSDTGGWSATFGQAEPPHGETFFHAPAGRYSDGRLLIDFIAEGVGIPYLNAYLDSMGSNFSHGANFATAAATIRPQNSTSLSPFSLNVQVYQFHDFRQRLPIIRNRGDVFKSLMPKAEYFSEALYTFDIGQNDLTSVYFPDMSIDRVKEKIPDILYQFKAYIKEVYIREGRYFWIHNTGPLGCLTYMLNGQTLNATEMDQTGCAISLNEVAQEFNSGLKKIVAQLREEMPLAAITYVDIYSIKYDLISHAKKFGFENPFLACCGHGGKNNYDMQKRCGAKILENGKEVLVGSCKDPLVRISWDGAHYTEAANKWVFDRMVNGSYSDPPISLKMACYKQ
ncbi:GDSL esterase/lipase At3g26430-like [Chenopodium quinoa]|uniref:Uncharacterized protein n=1 Tax=Chenopodium quinoa TaxID=63459 RepID=A0A803L0V4_CHEQI|nr:GDSL esterase/lipase At3g26430-like [Chenopodium quinoa]